MCIQLRRCSSLCAFAPHPAAPRFRTASHQARPLLTIPRGCHVSPPYATCQVLIMHRIGALRTKRALERTAIKRQRKRETDAERAAQVCPTWPRAPAFHLPRLSLALASHWLSPLTGSRLSLALASHWLLVLVSPVTTARADTWRWRDGARRGGHGAWNWWTRGRRNCWSEPRGRTRRLHPSSTTSTTTHVEHQATRGRPQPCRPVHTRWSANHTWRH